MSSREKPSATANESFRDFELEQEQHFSLTGRISSRADDLQNELRRIRLETARIFRAWTTPSSSLSTATASKSAASHLVSVDDDDFQEDGSARGGGAGAADDSSGGASKSAATPFVGVGAMYEVTVAPKRNIGWAAWNAATNAAACARMAWRALYAFPVRGAATAPSGSAAARAVGFVRGAGAGVGYSLAFLLVGFVASPLVHLGLGAVNTARGLRNVLTNDRTFDVYCGRYRPIDLERERLLFLQTWKAEQRLLGRGRNDHRRQKLRAEQTARGFPVLKLMKDRLGAVGGIGPAAATGDSSAADGGHKLEPESDNYYSLLQVAPNAPAPHIKAAYRKLAKVLHPDVDPSPKARARFDKVTRAYQTLMDPQLRQAYDAGGAKFAEATKSNNAASVTNAEGGNIIMKGSPMEVVQRVYGGTPFEQLLVGPLLRSQWHMRAQGQTRVNLHSYEALETMRMLRLATFLASVLDAYAMSDDALVLFAAEELQRTAPHLAEKLAAAIASGSSAEAAAGASAGVTRPLASSLPGGGSFSAAAKGSKPDPLLNSSKAAGGKAPGAKPVGMFDVDIPREADRGAAPPLDAFTRRATAFATRLGKCCFGRQLLHEVGSCYVVSAQRYMGEAPMWKPRALVQFKAAAGLGRLRKALTGTPDPKNPTKMLTADDAAHFFAIEFDNAVCNLWMVVRFVAMSAARDTSIGVRVRDALFPAGMDRQDPDGTDAVSPMLLAQRLSRSKQAGSNNNGGSGGTKTLVQPRGPTGSSMRQVIATVKQLPKAEQEALVAAVAQRVQRARCVALKELGRVFVACGTPWKDLGLQECVEHVRKDATSTANTTLPPPF